MLELVFADRTIRARPEQKFRSRNGLVEASTLKVGDEINYGGRGIEAEQWLTILKITVT